MDKAKKIASKIKPEKRTSKTIENLKEATQNIKASSQKYSTTVEDANKEIIKLVEQLPDDMIQPAANIAVKVAGLLKQLQEGGNKEEIIKKLEALRIK